MTVRALAASWIITGDAAQPPIANGAVVVNALGGVLAVGPAAQLRGLYPSAKWEQHDAVLLPGLVNAHTHLELSALRGQVTGGDGFSRWVGRMVEARERLQPEHDGDAIDKAVSELLEFGTAAVGEVTNSLAGVDALSGAPLIGHVFHEVFGMRKDAGEVTMRMAEEARAALDPWPDNLRYAPAPHTPFTLHPDVFCELLRRARVLGELTSLHLCEHGAERAFLRDGGGPFAKFMGERGSTVLDWSPPGLDPVRYAASLGAVAPDVLCVHLTDARADEIAIVAEAGAPVVLCPRSNLHIELKLPPLRALLDAGLRPALGTDSLASSPSLDVLGEARALRERFPNVAARTLIAMATSWGADALGFGAQLGTLAVGKVPGVVGFFHGASAPSDPESFVLSKDVRTRKVLVNAGTQLPSTESP
jgi:cytosine/adenosine deaminase-related metal-dependent hydrolase